MVISGVTFSCIWVSLTAYTAVSVPSASLATVQGILHGVYFGLGNGMGHLIGGLLIGAFGARVTFFGFSGASFIVLILFIIAQKVRLCSSITAHYYAVYLSLYSAVQNRLSNRMDTLTWTNKSTEFLLPYIYIQMTCSQNKLIPCASICLLGIYFQRRLFAFKENSN
jgi:MFS family permease